MDNIKYFYDSLEDFIVSFKEKFHYDDSQEIYLKGKSGFVGCRYLSRINEGEIRALLVNDKIVSIIDLIQEVTQKIIRFRFES